MAHARWNGVDGLDERTRAPYWRIGIRHDLADAARGYDWPRVLGILDDHPDCVNASRPGGRARYAPLHQAAHGGAPESVVRRLLAMGAWRTLRTRRGERPADIARRRGHWRVIPMLMPVYRRRRLTLDVLRRMQRNLHAVIREHRPGRAPCLRLPEVEPLLEMGHERVYFEVPGMFGGFEYWLEDDGVVPTLHVETFCRIINVDLRYEVTPRGWSLVDEFDNGPEFRPVSSPPPALASIRPASGETAYVELPPAGRRRLDEIRKGTVIEFDNADVVERHRHPRGIRWMSLNRLMRLRDEETADQRRRETAERFGDEERSGPLSAHAS